MDLRGKRALALAAGIALALPGVARAADAEAGLELAEQWCNACHSIGDEQRQEDAGPLFTELAEEDEAFILAALNRPHDFMPDFPTLEEEDKADLAAYILSLAE